MSKLKYLLILWMAVLLVCVGSTFAYNYCDSVGHWASGAWEAIAVGSIIPFVVLSMLSVAVIIGILEGKIKH